MRAKIPTPIPEKVRIFVSSTIEECSQERQVARSAIESLNHDAILFESTGARPYPPRNLYLRKIEEAHVFVGIYKHQYGYVAKDMAISGIDDEYQTATRMGMPRLLYIYNEGEHREQKLDKLLNEMRDEGGVTYSKYLLPSDLFQRIRDDVEAVVADRFYRVERLEALLQADAASAVEAAIPVPAKYIARPLVLQGIEEALNGGKPVQVVGPMGVGKTLALAELARQRGFIFVGANRLTRKDLASVLTNKLRGLSGTDARPFLNADLAYSDLLQAWKSRESFTVVIDDPADDTFVPDFLRDVGGVTAQKRLVYSEWIPSENLGHNRIEIPPFTLVEVEELVAKSDTQQAGLDVHTLYERSGGNPLYLHYYFSEKPEGYPSIGSFETSYWKSLDARGKEVVGYLAIANTVVSLQDLSQMLTEKSSDEMTATLQSLRLFVREEPAGYSLIHAHLRETVLGLLAAQPHRYAYYARRVADLLIRRADYARAYIILDLAGDAYAQTILRMAEFDASQQGDLKTLVYILETGIRKHLETGVQDLAFRFLALSQARHNQGHKSEAAEALSEAKRLAGESGDAVLVNRTRELESWINAIETLSSNSVEDLRRLKSEYERLGDYWSAARVSVDLSAVLIRVDRFAEAASEAEAGLAVFEKENDRYGISVARRNLISALSQVPGEASRVQRLLTSFQDEHTGLETLREKAWRFNVLTSQFRKAGELTRAKELAEEAIRIGETLGDSHVIASNRVNLGNVLRDQGRLDEAKHEYESVAALAQRAGFKDIEVVGMRLAASMCNQLGEVDLAIQYAEYASGLARGTAATSEQASCLEELADAYLANRRRMNAASTYVEAAVLSRTFNDKRQICRLGLQGLRIYFDDSLVAEYLNGLDSVFQLAVDKNVDSRKPVTTRLFDRIPGMLAGADRDFAILLFGMHFRLMFKDLPSPVARYLFQKVASSIFASRDSTSEFWPFLFPFMPLLTAMPKNSLRLVDLVAIGDQLTSGSDGLYFKPQRDGAAHWVVRLRLAEPSVISITSLDDRVDTAIATFLLVLFLKGFEKEIQEEIILAHKIGRNEVTVSVVSLVELPEDIRALLPTTIGKESCAVTRPTFPAGDRPVPTMVICRTDISDHWEAESGRGSAVQFLLGLTLVEIVFQLFRGEVEVPTLQPKIIDVIRKTIS